VATSSGTARLDGAQMFSRLMAWICLALSATTACAVVGLVAVVVMLQTTDIIPCKAANLGKPPFQASFSCSVRITQQVTTTVTQATGGAAVRRTTTKTTTQSGPIGFSPGDLALPLLVAPPLLLAAALWQAAGFFRQLFKGRAFSGLTVRLLRNFSVLGVLFLILNPMMPDMVKTMLQPFHIQPATIVWNSGDIFGWKATASDLLNIVFAAVLVAMVSVLARAAAIAEDHAQIV